MQFHSRYRGTIRTSASQMRDLDTQLSAGKAWVSAASDTCSTLRGGLGKSCQRFPLWTVSYSEPGFESAAVPGLDPL